jgi:hypothetical protein
VTVTGPVPDAVFGPTCQLHDATPLGSAVPGRSPPAVAGPDLYTTSIVQDAPGFVFTVAVARDPFATGDVSEVNANVRLGATVGRGVDGAVDAATGGTGVGMAVGASEGVGVSSTVCLGAGDNVGDALADLPAAVGVGCAGTRRVSCKGRDATAAIASDSATTIVAFCRRDAALHRLTMGAGAASLGLLDMSGDHAGSQSSALGMRCPLSTLDAERTVELLERRTRS